MEHTGVAETVLVQVLLHPEAFVTVTVKVPTPVTDIQLVVAPVFHRYVLPVATGAQSVLVAPGQMVLSPVMVQTGRGVTVTVLVQVLLDPFRLFTVTEYVPAELTVMQFVVAPLLHKYPNAPAGTQSCVDFPGQKELLPLMRQRGLYITETILLQVLLQPLESVMVTE